MIKRFLFLLIFLVFTTSILSISLDFNESILGPEKPLVGNILLPASSYDKTAKIKLSLDGKSAEESIKDLIDCSSNCEKKSSNLYIYSGATSTEISDSNFTSGIRIKKGSQINIDAQFKISNFDSDAPQEPSIDVGEDNRLDWQFQGQSITPTSYSINPFRGPEIDSSNAADLNLDTYSTCQNIYLNKSDKFKIKAVLKRKVSSPPTLGVIIYGYETKSSSCGSLNDVYSDVICELSLSDPLESNSYKICLSTSSSDKIVLAANNSALDPNGYRCTSSSCTKIPNTDYAIQAQSANFETLLTSEKIYKESNLNPAELLKDIIGNYLLTCTYDNDYCIIPIRISSKNNAKVKIYGLNYIETLSDGQAYDRNKFLLGVRQEGSKEFYKTTKQNIIPLSQFDLKSPSEIGNYELKVEYGLDSLVIPLEVVPAPEAKASVSLKFAPTFQLITFDGSNSESNSTLTYLWNFGDNSTSNQEIATHAYSLPGKYKASLTVTDKNNISDNYRVTIEIFSEKAGSELITSTISKLTALQQKYSASNSDIKDVFQGLGFETKLNNYLSQLSTSSALTESDVNAMLNTLPASITIINKLSISPYLSSKETDQLYGFETPSYRTTLQEMNSKFKVDILARSVSLSYPNAQDSFILVKKTITTPQALSDVSVIENIPLSLIPSPESLEFPSSLPELTRLQDYESAKFFLPNLQDSFTFYYMLGASNLDAVKDTILIVMPQDLSPSLIPFNCGDGLCNPAEDVLSCPEDCQKSTEEGFSWFTFILILVILIVIIFVIYYFKLYEKLKLNSFIGLITSKFQKSPFKSGVELQKVRSYIQEAIKRGYTKEKITSTLLEKGWSETQIKHAFKKLK